MLNGLLYQQKVLAEIYFSLVSILWYLEIKSILQVYAVAICDVRFSMRKKKLITLILEKFLMVLAVLFSIYKVILLVTFS